MITSSTTIVKNKAVVESFTSFDTFLKLDILIDKLLLYDGNLITSIARC